MQKHYQREFAFNNICYPSWISLITFSYPAWNKIMKNIFETFN